MNYVYISGIVDSHPTVRYNKDGQPTIGFWLTYTANQPEKIWVTASGKLASYITTLTPRPGMAVITAGSVSVDRSRTTLTATTLTPDSYTAWLSEASND